MEGVPLVAVMLCVVLPLRAVNYAAQWSRLCKNVAAASIGVPISRRVGRSYKYLSLQAVVRGGDDQRTRYALQREQPS